MKEKVGGKILVSVKLSVHTVEGPYLHAWGLAMTCMFTVCASMLRTPMLTCMVGIIMTKHYDSAGG
jgi:hypothetical protein